VCSELEAVRGELAGCRQEVTSRDKNIGKLEKDLEVRLTV